jgi:ATP-dependent helicase HrpB
MVELPIDSHIPRIVDEVRRARAAVIVAEPGAGKTTRVPPALLRAGLFSPDHPNLVMLQPRRVAARAAAKRIADEQPGWQLGREVGYHVRFERKLTDQTRLRVITEGILNRQLLDDPFLEGVGCVVLDEFHERSVHTDLAIAMLKEVRESVRDDLVLIVMSATLEAGPVAKFLGDAPIINVPGRTHPIEIAYRGMAAGYLDERVARAVEAELELAPTRPGRSPVGTGEMRGPVDAGDVLVFLPGVEEIRRAQQALEPVAGRENLDVLPLHGSLTADEQDRALAPSARRKIILATNIAETSLTIEGVTTVVDSGLERVAGYDLARGMDKLELKSISKASATQRAGRAGRTGPGRAVRLWTAKEHEDLDDYHAPEIHRVDLSTAVLGLHAWGKTDARQFGWYESPGEDALTAAEGLLEMLGAIVRKDEASGRTGEPANGRTGALSPGWEITALGRRILSLPVHPRVGRLMIEAADSGYLREGATIAAVVSEKDFVLRKRSDRDAVAGGPKTIGDSDLVERITLLDDIERRNFAGYFRDEVDLGAARNVCRIRDELVRMMGRGEDRTGDRASRRTGDDGQRPARGASSPARPVAGSPDRLLQLPLLAYPDRVVRRRDKDPMAGVMVGGGGVRLADESVVRRGEFYVAVDVRADERARRNEALVRLAGRVDEAWLEELFPGSVRRVRELTYDPARQKVVARGVTYYRDLPLREDDNAPVDPRDAGPVLAGALAPGAREIFDSDAAARTWLARLGVLRGAMKEHPWPTMDDAQLADVLAQACTNKRSLDEVKHHGLADLLQSSLHYPLDRLFEKEAPTTIEVPTGTRVRVDYLAAGGPVLAVRLQELFGWTQTPRIAAGRVPLVLHLLGPNFRPVQVTEDLASFWKNTYFQVRKDLKARYPKHSWPEDPLTAKPEAKGRHRN